MNDLYDIITALRQKHRMSLRMLALQSHIPPTTLASLMSRRPSTIDKSMLLNIALTFDVNWVDMLNKPESYATECALQDRIPVEMTQEDIEAVRKKLIDPLIAKISFKVPYEQRLQTCQRNFLYHSNKNDFERSFMFVLNKLNDDGLLEAMKRILEITEEPKFRKENKEDKIWREEELPMAAEQSESEQMDDMKQ